MIDEQFLQTIPQYGIGGFVGKIFKKVKDTVKKVAPIAGAGIGFLIGGSAGAGIGAGIGSLVAGKKPEEALKNALLGYGVGSLAGRFGPQFLKDAAGSKSIFGIGGQGDVGNVFNLFSGKAPADKITELENAKAELISIGNNTEAKKIQTVIDQIQTQEILKQYGFNKSGVMSGSGLGKVLTAGAFGLPVLDYYAQSQALKDFVPADPMGLNPLYYSDPQGYQVSGLGVKPYYIDDTQNYFGVPREDLPTDFVRAAEGGVIQLANGSEKYFPRKNGAINGPGTGTSDDIPAMLSDGEFVFTAKAVRNAGGGDRREGAKRMYQMMKNLEKGGTLSRQSRGVA